MTLATFLPIYYIIIYFKDYSIIYLETSEICYNLPIDTSLTFIGFVYEIVLIYLLGIVSGLLSSLFKRLVGIKDYSDLLGPHGGWVDRIDSIIIPLILKI